ncbi:hypothetical protein [Medusavirus stheno T3]|uniref:Uncharacterized protein n=1 Tax=Medusavirus stheno T3 TaxID=3069717 RepID=A0A7S8BEP1_9VIRU|nr:hypothetical protein QKU73_gp137 [Acanthamoeba castellanii medusavirus]QPB44318.1 hypothetical protein [Medusavirus stheno T3]
MDSLPNEILWVIVCSSGLTLADSCRLALGTNKQFRQLHDDHVDRQLAAYARESRSGTTVEWVQRHNIVAFARSMNWKVNIRPEYPTARAAFLLSLSGYLPAIERTVTIEEAIAEFVEKHRHQTRHVVVDVEPRSHDLYRQVQEMDVGPCDLVIVDWEGSPPVVQIGGWPDMAMPRPYPINSQGPDWLLRYNSIELKSRGRVKLTMVSLSYVKKLQDHVCQRLGIEETYEFVWSLRTGDWGIFACSGGSGYPVYVP